MYTSLRTMLLPSLNVKYIYTIYVILFILLVRTRYLSRHNWKVAVNCKWNWRVGSFSPLLRISGSRQNLKSIPTLYGLARPKWILLEDILNSEPRASQLTQPLSQRTPNAHFMLRTEKTTSTHSTFCWLQQQQRVTSSSTHFIHLSS